MIRIAIYGKGGIGKSTTTANVSAALSHAGYRVMQIGCDPKADSTRTLTDGVPVPTILNVLLNTPDAGLHDLVHGGYNGVFCAETGGPIPGLGCAGRGIITAFEKLDECRAFETLRPDVVLYDVLGDVVCGGFAMPIRNGYAQKVFVVTSGEAMSLFAAENIHGAVERFKSRGYAQFGGFILNQRGVSHEEELVKEKAESLGTHVVHLIPRDDVVQACENRNRTVVELFPDHDMAKNYGVLARKLVEG